MTRPPASPAPAARRRRDPQATRQRLVRAALELFTSRGYHASTTPQIAQRAAVAEGTIYRHFRNKSDLFNHTYRDALGRFAGALEALPSGQSAGEHLERVGEAWCELATREPAAVKLVFEPDSDALLDTRSRDASGELRGKIEELVTRGSSAGEVRPGPVDVWLDVWFELVLVALRRAAEGRPGAREVLNAAWDAIRVPTAPR